MFRLLALFVTILLSCFAQENGDEQQAFFQEHGYVWIQDFFSKKQVEKLKTWAEEINQAATSILEGADCEKDLIVVPESQNPLQVCRAENLLAAYPDCADFIKLKLATFLERFFKEPYSPFKDKINFKWPGGGAFLPHQDFPAFSFLAPKQHVTAMICIDPATLENGCLHVATNWKKTFSDWLEKKSLVLPYVEGGADHGSIQPQFAEKIGWLPLKTSPRDLLLFDSFIPHYSEPNTSLSPRRALFITFNRLKEGEYKTAYYDAKRNDPDNPGFHFGTPTNARGK